MLPIVFALSFAFTLSHLWLRKIYWLILMYFLWGLFILEIILPFNAEAALIEKVVNVVEGVFTYLILVVFFLMKYVEGTTLLKPVGYSSFKEKASLKENGRKYVVIVNTLLVFIFICFAVILFKKYLVA
ncbi:MAG: hypothetical protein JAY81_00670 [Candidatus Thiodiazotropha endolucinida]|nr:hypothetical protein [Candidatus Thiodiazotropha endolucinida]